MTVGEIDKSSSSEQSSVRLALQRLLFISAAKVREDGSKGFGQPDYREGKSRSEWGYNNGLDILAMVSGEFLMHLSCSITQNLQSKE